MHLPTPRGPLSEALVTGLRTGDDFLPVLAESGSASVEDGALTLWTLHQLHYREIDCVPDDLEWDPQLLRLRSRLEADLEHRLRSRFTPPVGLRFVDDFFDW